jgi:hypothetical protein
MNDDFEQRLREQRLRSLPGAWRSEILAAARAGTTKPDSAKRADAASFWNLIFGRFPVAWGALAAMWAVLFTVNFVLVRSQGTGGQQALLGSMEPTTVWRLQSAELRQLSHGDDAVTADTTVQPEPPVRPRSDKRSGGGLGGNTLRVPSETLA